MKRRIVHMLALSLSISWLLAGAARGAEKCRISGRLMSSEYAKMDGTVERAIVTVWTEARRQRVGIFYSKGEPFEFDLAPGRYRFVYTANGSRGATFRPTTRNITVPAGEKQLGVGTIDLPLTVTTRLYGKPAPELNGVAVWANTEPLTMARLRGKVVVLDFYAHSCSLCLSHKPDLLLLSQRYRRRGLQVLSVHDDSVGSTEELDAKLQRLPERLKVKLPLAIDGGGNDGVFARYGIHGVPAVVLIDRQGRVVRRFHHAGKRELELAICEALEERTDAAGGADPEGN